MRYLRKNTAVIISVGPFYDKGDGVTIETGLTITNEKITLVADTDDGSAPTNILDNVTGATSGTDNDLNYITNNDAGIMQLELSAANTNRNGRLLLSITDAANHVPVFHEFTVLDGAVYDSLVLGTDKLAVDAQEISSDATAANNAESFFDGTGYAGTNNVIPTVTNLTNERGKYMLGAVWVGPSVNTNTVSYVDGIMTNPVSTIAAAKTVADALGLRRFYTVRTGAVQVGAAMTGYDFEGTQWELTTTGGSRDVSNSSFVDAYVSGGTFASASGSSFWLRCDFATGVSVAASRMYNCTFNGTLTLNAAGDYDFIDCASVVAGTGTPVFAIPAGTVNVSFRRWSGGISITGITSGTVISIDMVSGGTVTLAGADGNVQVRGMVAGITDNRTGAPTLGQNAAINITKINAEVDTALADYDPPTNTEFEARTLPTADYVVVGDTLAAVTTVGSVSGAVGSVTGTVGSVTGAVGSVTGAVGSVTGNVGGNVVGSVGSVSGDTKQTADVATLITTVGVAGAGLTALATQASVNTIDDFLDTEVAAILADTNELQTDWANGGRLDLILDAASAPSAATVADAVWDELIAGHAGAGSTGAALAAAGSSGDPWSTALPGAYGAGTAGNIIGSQGATGAGLTAIPWNASWDAEVQSEVADALETAIADSVPADGAMPSIKQALYMIAQRLLDVGISGTTMTVYKPDGATALYTITLSDATNPTTMTRTG